MPAAPVQLGDGGLGGRDRTVDSGQAAQRVVAHDRQLYMGLRQPITHNGVAGPTVLLRHGQQPVELAPEGQLVAEERHAALEGKGGQGDAPAVADLAHHVVDVGAGTVEEDLVELARPSQLLDRPHLDPGLVHRYQQIGQPLVALGARIGPAHDKTPVGLVGQGGPHLLARHHPLVPVALGPRLDVRQVTACIGLRVALAPHLGALPDGWQEAGLLRRRPVMDQRGTEQPLAQDRDPARRGRPGVLLVEDDLLGDGGAPAAVLDRPAQAGPARFGQHLLPAQTHVEAVGLVARAAPPPELGELADQVLVQETPYFLAERHVLGAVSQIHRPGSVAKVPPIT